VVYTSPTVPLPKQVETERSVLHEEAHEQQHCSLSVSATRAHIYIEWTDIDIFIRSFDFRPTTQELFQIKCL